MVHDLSKHVQYPMDGPIHNYITVIAEPTTEQ